MKRNKSGISLIVLVITIIVMIILAAAVVITLNNTNIINRANEGVTAWDLNQVQNIAALAWAEAYLDKNAGETVNFQERVEAALTANGVTGAKKDKYIITATETGVEVLEANLGGIVRGPEDYGKTVNYTANNISSWRVLYEDEANDYVFLISETGLNDFMSYDPTTADYHVAVSTLSTEEIALYRKFQVGSWDKAVLQDPAADAGYTMNTCQMIAKMIKGYTAYANKDDYGDYVVGAIASPTIELIAAGYNAKVGNPILNLTLSDNGYLINGADSIDNLTVDGLYIKSGGDLLASTVGGYPTCQLRQGPGFLGMMGVGGGTIYPVVCLKSSTPVLKGTTTDIALNI